MCDLFKHCTAIPWQHATQCHHVAQVLAPNYRNRNTRQVAGLFSAVCAHDSHGCKIDVTTDASLSSRESWYTMPTVCTCITFVRYVSGVCHDPFLCFCKAPGLIQTLTMVGSAKGNED